jgi:hypothetical protein
MVKYLLVFLFIYVLLFIINTNDVEKKMLYQLMMHGDYRHVSQHPVEYDVGIGKYLMAPFYFDRNRLMKVSDGELVNAYCFTKPYAKMQQNLQSKIFWDMYLSQNGIDVPKLYATTKPFQVYDDLDPEKEYISKPEYGTTGNGIKLVKGKDVKPTETNHLIQEKIGSCGYDGSRTFRVITTHDGEVLVIYEFKNDDKVTSNLVKGGTSRKHVHVPEIEDTVEKLRQLHVRDFDFCFTIGWDLMVDCDGVYVLEGNWPCGLYGKINKNDAYIERVKVKAKEFYALNNM